MKLIDKSALVAEIERRLKYNHRRAELDKSPSKVGRAKEDKDILSFLDALEVKEVDLEKEIEWEWVHREKQEVSFIECAEMDKDEFVRFARHFFELGLKVAQKGGK